MTRKPPAKRRFAIYETVQGSEVRTWTVEATDSIAALIAARAIECRPNRATPVDLTNMLTNGRKGRQ